ncbi:MAG: dihydroorotase, partial [Betaproteobacteria bacterium]|nr:dihydroorotase [Betaproteobacteria bacterium]
MRISLRGGRLVGPVMLDGNNAKLHDARADLHLANGRILAIGEEPLGFSADLSLDLSQYCIAPGLVDLAARLREPGFEYKATLESEMQAALEGGIT